MAPERPPPAFAEAGQQSGLQVWRVERLELVPVPPSRHGDFFVGDAYLVLRTERRGAGVAYRLHYWLGRSAGSRGRHGREPAVPALLPEGLPGSRESGQASPPCSVGLRVRGFQAEVLEVEAEVGLPPRVRVMPSVIPCDAEGLSGGTVGCGRKVKACSLCGVSSGKC